MIREAWEEVGLALNERLLEPLHTIPGVDFWSYPMDRDIDCLQPDGRNMPDFPAGKEGEGQLFTAMRCEYLPVRDQDREAPVFSFVAAESLPLSHLRRS